MLLKDLEKQIELGKKIATAMNWEYNKLVSSIGSLEVRVSYGMYRCITIAERSNIKNKILNFVASDFNLGKSIDLFKYKKPPGNTVHLPKQRPSKDRLFNHNVEMNIGGITQEELEKIEQIMDEYEGTIFIHIQVGNR